MEFCLFISWGPSYCAVGIPANASTVVVGISDGGREQQGQEGHWADPGSSTREGTHPETTAAEGVLCTSQQIEGAEWRCKVRTCCATSHKLRKSEELPELSVAARLDLVRECYLSRLWLGRWGGKIKGKRCQLRNMIRKELCQEQMQA
jgi:hypothetical protein